MVILANKLCDIDNNNNMLQSVAKNVHTFGFRPVLQKLTPCLTSVTVPSRNFHPSLVSAQKLPRLPVPALMKTLEKYLKSVKPFLNKDEFSETSQLVQKFGQQNGLGDKLQLILSERARRQENWLAEWWLNSAYLDYRYPVVVYSSPGLVFPMQNFQNDLDRLKYAAQLILAAVDYKRQIDGDKIPLEKMGKDPLDMSQYKKIFGTCRIPGIKRDSLDFNPTSKHVAVVHNNHFFKLAVWNDKGELHNEQQLIEQLEYIIENSKTVTAPVGVLTTEHRDRWGAAYGKLVEDPSNQKSLMEIQKSLFLVCLDKPMPNMGTDDRQTIAGAQLIHAGGSKGNAGNRWYDKTVQFVIGHDGLVGLTYEHSPSEGQPIAVMTDYLVDFMKDFKNKNPPPASVTKKPQRLAFKISEDLQTCINTANGNLDKLVEDLDIDCFTFRKFGKEFVKSQKLSPDSFIQMAMQYAFYRIHKEPGAHYESAATRKYIHGRTETIRSCSVESIKFAQTMLNSSASAAEKANSMREAIQAHKQYSVDAVNGYGVDRHLLGLKLICQEYKIELPELYSDKSFKMSTHMRISSSQVATKCDGFMCYGPLVDDGYACCYNPRPDDMNFGITAFNSCSETSATSYRKALEQSLIDMQDVLVKSPRAKL